MRILFLCNQWHLQKQLVSWLDCPELAAAGHEFIPCVADPLAREPAVGFDLCSHTIHDIAARVPGGAPDLMLVWEPGYQALPQAIEEAAFPVVALLSDWNLVLRPQVGMLGVFDYIFTDRPGVEVVKRLGHQRVEYWPMWGHDPRRFRIIPDLEQTWDVTMIGNLNHDVQRERARWLYHLAKLGDRWRVRIAGGVYGDEYLRMLSQSKITFNRSIRREFNMRCYEAAACGSLLFYDEENEEVRDYFDDRVHCVLYNQRNFEELLAHYLTRDDERAAIVAAARERVREISQPRALLRLLGRIEELGLLDGRLTGEGVHAPGRPYAQLPLVERRKRHARQVFRTMTPGNLALAANWIGEALRAAPTDSSLLNDYAVVAAYLAEAQREDFVQANQAAQVAVEAGKRAVAANPDSALAQINLGQIYKRQRRFAEAQTHLLAALRILDQGDEGATDLLELHFPFEHDQFRTQYETLYATCAGDDHRLRLARRCLLIHQAGMALGELAQVAADPKLAGWAYQVAAVARPDLGRARAALARCLIELGQIDDALEQLECAFATDPFLSKEWFTYADVLIARGRYAQARAFLEERLTVIAGVPALAHLQQPAQERVASLVGAETRPLQAVASA
jgi:tetratricopeptide (TPR) repeat protein